jgi:hypothetical protein
VGQLVLRDVNHDYSDVNLCEFLLKTQDLSRWSGGHRSLSALWLIAVHLRTYPNLSRERWRLRDR